MRMPGRLRTASVAALAIATFMGSAAPAQAVIAIIRNETAVFGPLPASVGEVVRVNVTALGGPDTLPAEVAVRFRGPRGGLIREVRLTVEPGHTAFADLRIRAGMPLPDAFNRHTSIAEIVGFNPQPDPPRVLVTLEVFNARTGRTRLFIGDPNILPEF